jgi:hypothetical protein
MHCVLNAYFTVTSTYSIPNKYYYYFNILGDIVIVYNVYCVLYMKRLFKKNINFENLGKNLKMHYSLFFIINLEFGIICI